MGKTLDSFCLKRNGGGYVSKTIPFLKSDLKRICCCAAVLCLLWYLSGRASDLAMLQMQNVSVDAGGVLFLRLIRMKTSE
ncbi:hypothetical protein PHMEG_00012523 [Phytophthora megakarya]|uniref:Uncharacterized protein n=1 Tax=Phytophthora megakarya TaxID=4795 RepID=A0A225WB33_9STRA|nr:hypothetical protein PHMEG_00012523 [Phytophthora megakarya]